MSDDTRESFQAWVRSVVDQHSGPLVRYAASLTGDMDSARDAAQETFLRLVRQPREKTEPHLKPWLYRVCRTRALDYLRKEGRMSHLSDTAMALQPAPDDGPGVRAETTEAGHLVLHMLETLPPAQREAVRLKFQNGLSYREIADVTGRSVGAVGVLLHTAIKTLRQRVRTETDLMGPLQQQHQKKAGA